MAKVTISSVIDADQVWARTRLQRTAELASAWSKAISRTAPGCPSIGCVRNFQLASVHPQLLDFPTTISSSAIPFWRRRSRSPTTRRRCSCGSYRRRPHHAEWTASFDAAPEEADKLAEGMGASSGLQCPKAILPVKLTGAAMALALQTFSTLKDANVALKAAAPHYLGGGTLVVRAAMKRCFGLRVVRSTELLYRPSLSPGRGPSASVTMAAIARHPDLASLAAPRSRRWPGNPQHGNRRRQSVRADPYGDFAVALLALMQWSALMTATCQSNIPGKARR
jgi:hypothetical protein